MLTVSRKCRINGMKPEAVMIIFAIQQAERRSPCDMVIGHVRDGEHSDKSLHYVGYAVDLWLTGAVTNEEIDKVELDLKLALTPEFDIVPHYDGERFTHFHIEFQPKARLDRRVIA